MLQRMERIGRLSFIYLPKLIVPFPPSSLKGSRSCTFVNSYTAEPQDFRGLNTRKVRVRNSDLRKSIREYEENLINELLTECGVENHVLSMTHSEKKRLLWMDIDSLKKMGYIAKKVDVTKNLLSNLETFPYNETLTKTLRQIKSDNTIRDRRNSIEKQYLMWKFETDLPIIKKLLFYFRFSLSRGRSIKSMKRNLEIIEKNSKVNSLTISNKIYLMNIKPFALEFLDDFQNRILGLDWFEIGELNPWFLKWPYANILFFVELLKEKNFTDDQIRTALPYIRHPMPTLFARATKLFSDLKCYSNKNHERFLTLLNIPLYQIKVLNENGCEFAEYLALTEEIKKSRPRKLTTTELCILLQKHLDIQSEDFLILRRHPLSTKALYDSVSETINYLKSEFSVIEILESIFIVLYPKEAISESLKIVRQNPEFLQRVHFKNGHITTSSKENFKKGLKLNNRTLQLCLYLIEKSLGSYSNPPKP